MAKKLKLKVKLIDKHKIYPIKAKYDPVNRVAEAKKGLREKTTLKFWIDPDHIYEEFKRRNKRDLVCYVDITNRKSVNLERAKVIIEDGKKKEEIVKENVEIPQSQAIHSDDDIDYEDAVKTDYLIDVAFLKSLASKRQIPRLQIILILLAGIGIYSFIVLFLRACGINV